jgi:PHD/YefM family antitoxin component YafN of YafNO toxin-antitoxin module
MNDFFGKFEGCVINDQRNVNTKISTYFCTKFGIMKAVNYSELRQKLKFNLDSVTDNDELLVVHRPKGRSIIMMSLTEYNSRVENSHLNGSYGRLKTKP